MIINITLFTFLKFLLINCFINIFILVELALMKLIETLDTELVFLNFVVIDES